MVTLVPHVRSLLSRVYSVYGLPAPTFTDSRIEQVLREGSYFADCPRDSKGYCDSSGGSGGSVGGSPREKVAAYRDAKQKLADLSSQWQATHAQWNASKDPADLDKLNTIIGSHNAAQDEVAKAGKELKGVLPALKAQKRAVGKANSQGHAHLEAANDHAMSIPDPDPGPGRSLPSHLRNSDIARVKYAGEALRISTPRAERLQRLQTIVTHAPKALASVRSADISRLDDDAKQLHHDAVAGLSGAYSSAKKALASYAQASAAYRGKVGEAKESLSLSQCEPGKCECEDCRRALQEQAAPSLLALPDERQETGWSCGAACCTSVARYFSVEPDTEAEAVLALGSSPRDGTDPEHLVQVLQNAGLETVALSGMGLDEVEYFLGKGMPLICPIQAWAETPEEVQRLESGHYVVIYGTDPDNVLVMDPARFDPSEVPGEYGGRSLGGQKVAVPRERLVAAWVDVDGDGNRYLRYGIAIRKPTGASA